MITAERLATQERAWGLLEDLRLLSRFRRWYLTDFPEDIKITFLQWSQLQNSNKIGFIARKSE